MRMSIEQDPTIGARFKDAVEAMGGMVADPYFARVSGEWALYREFVLDDMGPAEIARLNTYGQVLTANPPTAPAAPYNDHLSNGDEA